MTTLMMEVSIRTGGRHGWISTNSITLFSTVSHFFYYYCLLFGISLKTIETVRCSNVDTLGDLVEASLIALGLHRDEAAKMSISFKSKAWWRLSHTPQSDEQFLLEVAESNNITEHFMKLRNNL